MTSDPIRRMPESGISIIVYAVALTVVTLVAFLLLNPGAFATGVIDVSYAPRLHAFINSSTAVLLTAGYIAVRKRKLKLHRTLMLGSFSLSCVFLISYVVYHSQKAEPTHFGAEGAIKIVYFFILITHIILAAAIVPMALFTIVRSWRSEFERHKKIARITLPIWLYVSISGVVVYLMLYVLYPSVK